MKKLQRATLAVAVTAAAVAVTGGLGIANAAETCEPTSAWWRCSCVKSSTNTTAAPRPAW
jgi:hypothetical protein